MASWFLKAAHRRRAAAGFSAWASLALACGAHAQTAPSPGAGTASEAAAPRPVGNQLGFKPGWPQQLFLASPQRDTRALRYTLHQAGNPKALRELNALAPLRDTDSEDWIRQIDLGPALPAGRYQLRQDNTELLAFDVGPNVYQPLHRALLRAFYLQRCGPALNDAETGLSHEVCHAEDGTLAHADDRHRKGHPMATAGGWHDAGDYGKYVATTAVAIGRILAAYERAPARFKDDATGIPESGNRVPDLLDEMQVGLDWMLTMQRGDGAVYRKVGGNEWPKELAPQHDRQTRWVYGISSPETAKAAAVWAQAARLYRPHAPALAARYLAASRLAWEWLGGITQAQRLDIHPGDDAGSGPYRANDIDTEASLHADWDDRLWAATELYLTTGEPAHLQWVQRVMPRAPLNLFEWKDPSGLAMAYLLWHPKLQDQAELLRQVRPRFLQRAKTMQANHQRSGWRIANDRFVWGSNKMTAEEGITLCLAYQASGNPAYLNAARDQLHYLLGRNHFGKSFVSGVGHNPVKEVSHLWYQVHKKQIPGLFVGGPNTLEQSRIAPLNKGPLSWVDDARSYATNEFAIDYNASLLGLLAELETDCHTRPAAP